MTYPPRQEPTWKDLIALIIIVLIVVFIIFFHGCASAPPGNSVPSIPIPGKLEAENYIDYFDTTPGNAETDSSECTLRNDDVDLKKHPSGEGCVVGFFDEGEWLEYLVDISDSGYYRVEANYASPFPTNFFVIKLSDKDVGVGHTFGINLSETESWNHLQVATRDSVHLPKGYYLLRVERGANWFDLDWLKFSVQPSDTTPPDTLISQADTIWAPTQLGTLMREAKEASDRGLTKPVDFDLRRQLYAQGVEYGSEEWYASGEDMPWNYDQWFGWYADRYWVEPEPEWPAYYWNPPSGFEERYPVFIIHDNGMIEYPPRNHGDITVIVYPGEETENVLPTREGEANFVRKR